ncbi:MAG: MOSC domain-containing protein [Armatimonas sp.]
MGNIVAIHIAPTAGAAPVPVDIAVLRKGAGIDGDRYSKNIGTYSHWPSDHELTLIEQAVVNDLGLKPGESRRNITVDGIALNPLVGQRFRLGRVLCEGTRLCEPCAYLERHLERPGIVRQLIGRGGLRALVLENGEIRVGDAITLE